VRLHRARDVRLAHVVFELVARRGFVALAFAVPSHGAAEIVAPHMPTLASIDVSASQHEILCIEARSHRHRVGGMAEPLSLLIS
jgi:hypothetical protein